MKFSPVKYRICIINVSFLANDLRYSVDLYIQLRSYQRSKLVVMDSSLEIYMYLPYKY